MKQGRKFSGGRYKSSRKKTLREKRGQTRIVTLGSERKKKIRILGGKIKTVLLRTDKANVFDQKTKKCSISKILNVIKVPSNIVLARRNVLVRGAEIETELGKAKITNRPSQEPSVQAVLIEEKKEK